MNFAAEVLDVPWEKVEVIWGDTSKNLPYTCTYDGSQTIHAISRSNHAAAMDAKRKLQEIAAKDLGGRPDDYRVGVSPPSFDKQFVRDWLEATDWDKISPPPQLPADVVERTRGKYLEAFERLTGRKLSV